MPIPKPSAGESKKDFISRCLENAAMREYPQNQRSAICYDAWRKRKFGNNFRGNISVLEIRKDILRTEKLNDRDFLVAPVVPIIEGVHNEEYVSYEELTIWPEMWDGRPLPVNHPMDQDGEPATASSPDVLESSVVGLLLNVIARDDIRGISGELWIDIEKAATVPGGAECLRKLQSGEQLEVSTGYFTIIDNIPGEWRNPKNGQIEKYTSSQLQIRPDHLALLPFDIGACDWKDGCGAPRINSTEAAATADHTIDSSIATMKFDFTANILSSARKPSYSGTESISWASVNKSFGAYAKAYVKSNSSSDVPSSVKEATSGMKKWIAAKTLLGDPAGDTNRDLIFFPVVNPGTGKLNEGALRAVISGRGSQANIPADTLTSAQDMARKLLKSEFGADMAANIDNKLCINGAQLGKALVLALEAHGHESGSDETLGRLAAAAGIDDTTMQAIVGGQMDFIPRQWINIFSAILDIDPYELYMASGNDNSSARYEASYEAASGINSEKDVKKEGADVTISDNQQDKNKEICTPCQKSLKTKVLEILQSLGLKGAETKEDTDTMNTNAETRKVKVDALIASDKNQFQESHREWLTSLSDEQIAVLEPIAVAKTTETVVAVAAAAAATENAAEKTAPVVIVMTKDQILATLGVTEDELKAAKSVNDEKKAARNAKITEIAGLANCKFSKAELESFSDSVLDRTLEMLRPESPFRIAAGTRTAADADSAISAAPVILLAKPGVYGVDYAVQTAQNAGRAN